MEHFQFYADAETAHGNLHSFHRRFPIYEWLRFFQASLAQHCMSHKKDCRYIIVAGHFLNLNLLFFSFTHPELLRLKRKAEPENASLQGLKQGTYKV